MIRIDEVQRDDDGLLPSYVWPGGYPILYVADDGETICPDCANGDDFDERSAYADGFRLQGAFVHYEGAPEVCAHCSRTIESTYGEPGDDA